MLKKIFNCVVIACLCLFGLFMTSCNDTKSEDPVLPQNCDVVLESTDYYFTEECKDFIAICNTVDELKELYSQNGYSPFAEDKVCEYMEEHSETKSLVVCVFGRTNYSGQYRIKEVEVNADKLTMHIKIPDSEVGYEVMNSVFLIAGVDKSFVADITDLSYVFV